MKKTLIAISCLLFACCTSVRTEQQATDAAVIQKHPQPLKIFSIGRWNEDYTILTLIDANNTYFTVTVKKNDNLKADSIYNP
jgi:outer membrane biogenesis lipoprotein LolB